MCRTSPPPSATPTLLDAEGGSDAGISLPHPEQDGPRRLCLLHATQHRSRPDVGCDAATVVGLHAAWQGRDAQAGLEAAVETVPELRQGHAGAALRRNRRRRAGFHARRAPSEQACMRLKDRTAVVTARVLGQKNTANLAIQSAMEAV